MGFIELSAELQHTNCCSADQADSSKDIVSADATMVSERQQSGSSCSTSSSISDPQPGTGERQKVRPSSVRSRAAFFEALNTPLSPNSPPLSPENPRQQADNQLRLKPLSNRGSIDMTLVMDSPPSGQEVEMVDQGCQEQAKLNKNASQPRLPLVSSPTVASPKWLINRNVHHSSFPEIQSSTTEQTASQTGVAERSPGCNAATVGSVEMNVPVSHVVHGDGEGIELQEQGHTEMLQHALERLQSELIERDRQSVAAASALACKTQECESLMHVVRELTENRSKLVCARTNLAEKLAEMQHEYMRLMRVADLSRVVSKENVAKTAKVVKTLKQVEDESARQQHLIGYFKERNKNLKDENFELKERVCLLERLDLLSYSRDSVCMREFKLHALKETY
ncbi:hypothetical protein WJX79_007946 [Trebouxia sp. C0005]